MPDPKLAFFGSEELAVVLLERLEADGRTPALVVADLPPVDAVDSGRAPAALWAEENGVPLLELENYTDPRLVPMLAGIRPDLLVAADLSRPLGGEVLAAAPLGGIEVHPSLLPRLRGPDAIRCALIDGAKKTGVSVLNLAPDEELDAGPILSQEEVDIEPRQTFGELSLHLGTVGADLLSKALKRFAKGRPKGKPQNEKQITQTPGLTPRHRKLPWPQDAGTIFNRLRAFAPRPGLTTYFRVQPVQVLWGTPVDWEEAPFGSAGTFLGLRQGRIAVLCGSNTIFGIDNLRLPEGEPMTGGDFVHKFGLRVGDRFL